MVRESLCHGPSSGRRGARQEWLSKKEGAVEVRRSKTAIIFLKKRRKKPSLGRIRLAFRKTCHLQYNLRLIARTFTLPPCHPWTVSRGKLLRERRVLDVKRRKKTGTDKIVHSRRRGYFLASFSNIFTIQVVS